MKNVELILQKTDSAPWKLILPIPGELYSNLQIDIFRLDGYNDNKPDTYTFCSRISFRDTLLTYHGLIEHLSIPHPLKMFVSNNVHQSITTLPSGCTVGKKQDNDYQQIRFTDWKPLAEYIQLFAVRILSTSTSTLKSEKF